MIKRLLTILIFSISGLATASNYYWVGNTGNWNDLTKWANSSGGAGSAYAQIPTSIDNVFFDANSFNANSQVVTINVTAPCLDMTWSGLDQTSINLTVNSPLEVFGNLALSANMSTINIGYASEIRMLATSGTKSITTNGVIIGQDDNAARGFVIGGTGATFNLNDNIAVSGYFSVLAGTFNANNFTITAGLFRSNGSTSRTLNLGTSLIKIKGSTNDNNSVNMTATGITLNATTAVFSLQPSSTTYSMNFYSASLTYGRVVSYASFTQFYSTDNVTANYSDLYIYGNTNIGAYGSGNLNQISDTLCLNGGKTYGLYGTVTLGATSTLLINSTCARLTKISNQQSYTCTFTRTGGWGAMVQNWLVWKSVTVTGAGTFTSNNSFDDGGNSGVTINTPAAQTYYWIGNTGNWADGNHWSLTSGGAASGCVPTPVDSTVFDNNSFSLASQTVTVDTVSAYCKGMTWTAGVTGTPVLRNSASLSTVTQFNIYGSLTFATTMSNTMICDVNFRGNQTSVITSATRQFCGAVYFESIAGTGTYSIADDFDQTGSGSTLCLKYVYLNKGTLNTNGKIFRCRAFLSESGLTRTLNLSSSYVYVTNDCSNPAGNHWQINGTNFTLNAGTSKIYLNGSGATPFAFNGGSKTYNHVEFTNVIETPNAYAFTVDSMLFDGNGYISSGNTFLSVLKLTPGKNYTFQAGQTQTFIGTAALDANGTCSGTISMSSYTPGSQTTFTKGAGLGNISANYCALTDMVGAGGSTYTANNSSDLGNNSGWTINAAVSRTLYWVGGTGNWMDNTHWSTTTTVLTPAIVGNCPPSLIDDVIFDVGSFTAGGQSVTINTTAAACRSMTWSAVTNSPNFVCLTPNQLSIYGNLTWAVGTMNFNFTSYLYFKGTGTILTNGKYFTNRYYFNMGAGTYTFGDNCHVGSVELSAGTVNTNNYNITCDAYFRAESNGIAKTFTLGSSRITALYFAMAGQCASTNAGLTLNAGTSTIVCTQAAGLFSGAGKTYYRIFYCCGAYNFGTNITVKYLYLPGNVTFCGTTLNITDSVKFYPTYTYDFPAGSTTTFGADCYVDGSGTTGSDKIYIISGGLGGTQANWVKVPGGLYPRVCVKHFYIRDNAASGGTFSNGNYDNQGNNTGWGFIDNYPVAENSTLSPDVTICPGTSVTVSLDYSSGPGVYPYNYPKIIIVDKIVGGVSVGHDSIGGVNSDPYTYTVNPTVSTTYKVIRSYFDGCFAALDNNLDQADVTVYSGRNGWWIGRTSNDWFLCSNWEDGYVPTSTTDVYIPSGVSNMPVIASAGAVCKHLKVFNSASLSMTSSASTIDVYGCLRNYGTVAASLGTVTMRGSSTTYIAGTNATAFNHLIINNSSNVRDSNNVTVNGAFTITAGKFDLYDKTFTLAGTIVCTDSILGSNSSTLNISGSGALGTIKFSKTNRTVGTLTINRTSSGTMTLGTPVSIVSTATFTNGYVVSTNTNYVEFKAGSSWSGASDNSFVSGPVRKIGNTAFTFPVGKNAEYHLIGMSAPAVGTDSYESEYFEVNPVALFGTNKDVSLDHVSTCEYWDFSRKVGTSDVYVTLSWTPKSCNLWAGVTSPADLVVAHWWDTATDIWEDRGASSYTGDNSSGTVTASLFSSSYSPFALASRTGLNPLPIELLSFDAKKNNEIVNLNWITAAEINNDYFTVERSSDNKKFDPIVKTTGAGNSSVQNKYDAVDYFPIKGMNYYRLKQTDYDGKYSYSKIVPINFSTSEIFDVSIYPNPINSRSGNITMNIRGIEDESSVVVVLRDVLGKEYFSKVISSGNGDIQFVIDSSETLAKGVYIISASSNEKLISKKLIVE